MYQEFQFEENYTPVAPIRKRNLLSSKRLPSFDSIEKAQPFPPPSHNSISKQQLLDKLDALYQLKQTKKQKQLEPEEQEYKQQFEQYEQEFQEFEEQIKPHQNQQHSQPGKTESNQSKNDPLQQKQMKQRNQSTPLRTFYAKKGKQVNNVQKRDKINSYQNQFKAKFPLPDIRQLRQEQLNRHIKNMQQYLAYLNSQTSSVVNMVLRKQAVYKNISAQHVQGQREAIFMQKMIENKNRMLSNQNKLIHDLQSRFDQIKNKEVVQHHIFEAIDIKQKLAQLKKDNHCLELKIKNNSKDLVESSNRKQSESYFSSQRIQNLVTLQRNIAEESNKIQSLQRQKIKLLKSRQTVSKQLQQLVSLTKQKGTYLPIVSDEVKLIEKYCEMKKQQQKIAKAIPILESAIQIFQKNIKYQQGVFKKRQAVASQNLCAKNSEMLAVINQTLQLVKASLKNLKTGETSNSLLLKIENDLKKDLELIGKDPQNFKRPIKQDDLNKPKFKQLGKNQSLVSLNHKKQNGNQSRKNVYPNKQKGASLKNQSAILNSYDSKDEMKQVLPIEQKLQIHNIKQTYQKQPQKNQIKNNKPFTLKKRGISLQPQSEIKPVVKITIINQVLQKKVQQTSAAPRRFFKRFSKNDAQNEIQKMDRDVIQQKQHKPHSKKLTTQFTNQIQLEKRQVNKTTTLGIQMQAVNDSFLIKDSENSKPEQKKRFRLFRRNQGEDAQIGQGKNQQNKQDTINQEAKRQQTKREEIRRLQEQKQKERKEAQQKERARQAQLRRAMMGGGIKLKKQNKVFKARQAQTNIFDAAEELPNLLDVKGEQTVKPLPQPSKFQQPTSPALRQTVEQPTVGLHQLLGIKPRRRGDDDMLGDFIPFRKQRNERSNFWD